MVDTVGSEVGVGTVAETGDLVVSSPRSSVGWRMVTVDGANVGSVLLTIDEGAVDATTDAIVVGVEEGSDVNGGWEGFSVGSCVGLVVEVLLPPQPHSGMGASEI